MLHIAHPENPTFFVLVTESEQDRLKGRVTVRPGCPLPNQDPHIFRFQHSDRSVVQHIGELLVEASHTAHHDANPPWVQTVPYVSAYTQRHRDLRSLAHQAIDRMSEQELAKLPLPVWAVWDV